MLKKLLFLSISCSTPVLFSMEQQAKQIRVKTIDQHFDIQIQDTTTVRGIKEVLQEREAIPVAQQSIIPVLPVWWTLGYLEKYGTALSDSTRIKEAMNTHNTDIFQLCLHIRNKPTGN